MQIVRGVLDRVNGRTKIIVGTSHVGFDNLRQFTSEVMDAGASAIMVAPGTGLKTDDQIMGYFEGLVRAIGDDVPLVLQDYEFCASCSSVTQVSRSSSTRKRRP
jgi:4-hydroxy-tetrahydrodipicolinate synthase